MKKFFRLLILLISITGCNNLSENCDDEVIYLQPCNGYKVPTFIIDTLENRLNKNIIILSDVSIPKEYLTKRKRYNAINMMDSKYPSPYTILFLLHNDISVDYNNKKDWGVLGVSYTGGNIGVVSDFRLKNKKYFWKVILHEYYHSQGLHHCPDDNPKCIMKDAKGHADFSNKTDLCETCKNIFINL